MWYEESFGRSLKAFRSPGSQPLRLAPATDIPASQLYLDREGALWLAGEGLSRISSAEKLFDIKVVKSADILQKFSLRNGLSDVYAKKILEDREGNIWVGKHFSQVAGPMPHTNVTAVARDAAGTLWISEMQGGIFSQTTDRGWVHGDVLKGRPTLKADSMFADGAGCVWFAYSDVIALLDHGETRTYKADEGASTGRYRVITGCEQQV